MTAQLSGFGKGMPLFSYPFVLDTDINTPGQYALRETGKSMPVLVSPPAEAMSFEEALLTAGEVTDDNMREDRLPYEEPAPLAIAFPQTQPDMMMFSGSPLSDTVTRAHDGKPLVGVTGLQRDNFSLAAPHLLATLNEQVTAIPAPQLPERTTETYTLPVISVADNHYARQNMLSGAVFPFRKHDDNLQSQVLSPLAISLPSCRAAAFTSLPASPGAPLNADPYMLTQPEVMVSDGSKQAQIQAVVEELPQIQPYVAPITTAATEIVVKLNPQIPTSESAPLILPNEGIDRTQQLQQALGERLQLQIKDHIQQATIQLDPPDMGKVTVSLQLDKERIDIHISASHNGVYRALQQGSNDLRLALTEQYAQQVNVQVSAHSGQQENRKAPHHYEKEEAVFTGKADTDETSKAFVYTDDSILLTI